MDVPKRKPGLKPWDREAWGMWALVTLDGAEIVAFTCPNGHYGFLDHDIRADGTVHPSVMCPWKGCTYHEEIHLLDWPAGRVVELG